MTLPAGPIEFTEAEIVLILGAALLFVLIAVAALLTVAGLTPLGRWWGTQARSRTAAPLRGWRRCWYVTNAVLLLVGTHAANPMVAVGITAAIIAIAIAVGLPVWRPVALMLYLSPIAAVGWQIYQTVRLGGWFDIGPAALWFLAVAASAITAHQGTVLAARARNRRRALRHRRGAEN